MSECNENIFTCPSNDAALDMRQPTSNIPQCHPKGIFINIFQATGTAAASNTPTPTSQNAFNKHRVLSVGSLMFLLIRFICLDRNDFSLCGVFFIIIIKFVKMQISSPLFVVRQSCSSSRWQQKLEKKIVKKGRSGCGSGSGRNGWEARQPSVWHFLALTLFAAFWLCHTAKHNLLLWPGS